jgi:hypothetical protein
MVLETVSGRFINPTDPQPSDIDLRDIAWGLSRVARFGGHTITEVQYNVAQHSVYVAVLLEKFLKNADEFADLPNRDEARDIVAAGLRDPYDMKNSRKDLLMLALLHDAHECYLGDVISPIKHIPELHKTFTLLELKFDHAIRSALGIDEPTEEQRAAIHYFDKLAQAIEAYQFMRSRGLAWKQPTPGLRLLQSFTAPKPALQSYQDFLDHYEYLANL